MRELPVRGVIAPALVGVGVTFAVANLILSSHSLVGASLLPIALAMPFVRDTRRLLLNAFARE